MTMQPAAPPPSLDPMLVMRLYDETKEMRNDVAGMRGDLRDVATMMRTTIEQGHDHEMRLRAWEKDGVTKEDLDAVIVQVQDLQRGRWKTTGAAVAVSVLASSGIVSVIATKMLGH